MKFKMTITPDVSKLTGLTERYYAARERAFTEAMQASVDAVRDAAKGGIPSLTGRMAGTIFGEVNKFNTAVTGTISSTARRPYVGPYAANFGRQKNNFPNIGDIEAWILNKGLGMGGQTLEQTAFLIARKIKEKGTKAFHFMAGGLAKSTGTITQNFNRAVQSIIEELSK